MQWYYSKNGAQLGPVSESELRAKIASGEVQPTDLVWRDGMTDWLAASRVPEFAAGVPAMQVSGPSSGPSAPTPYAPPSSPASYQGAGQDIPNFLWQSIVVTILCCWPCGIPAIVYAAKVDGLKLRGDLEGARAASNSAKTWCLVSLGGWVLVILIYILVFAGAAISNH